jgi:hypothetical protein
MRQTVLLIWTSLVLAVAIASAAPENCSICGMSISSASKTTFTTERDGKTTEFDSFTCASRFQAKYPKAALWARDFLTGKKIEASKAFYLVKSEKIQKEVEFGMMPTVVAFADEAEARKKQKALGDGEIVKGFAAARKAYE